MIDLTFLPEFHMPKDFLWGAGYAGHQVEGNNIHSQNWYYEIQGNYVEKSGMACNSYELWERDAEIAAELQLGAFRTSVEWSRIEPQEGQFDQKAADHYVAFFRSLKEKGIRVFATMVHFTHPLWFEKKGQFANLDNRIYFERYLKFIVPQIAPYVDFWNVMNEFNLGNEPDRVRYKLACLHYHALGYHIIKQYSSGPISSAHALVQYTPRRSFDRWDAAIAEMDDLRDHEFFFHAIRTGEILYPYQDVVYAPDVKGTIDYWSINTYVRTMIDARRATSYGERYSFKKMKMIDMDFYLEEINPECVVYNLGRLKDKPVYITENGCSCVDDRYRIAFLSVYLSALREAISQGVDVRGYLYWSMLDNYEWSSYKPQFGLYAVDTDSFIRTPKPSAAFYRDIISHNGITHNMLAQHYLKET